jgi:hypothetical protein
LPAEVSLRWIRGVSVGGGHGMLVGASGLALPVGKAKLGAMETEKHASSPSH